MALPKDQSTTITVSAATRARLAELARDQDRPMGEIVTDLVERFGEALPATDQSGPASSPAEGDDRLAEVERLAAQYFGDEESRRVLLHFIEHDTIDDID